MLSDGEPCAIIRDRTEPGQARRGLQHSVVIDLCVFIGLSGRRYVNPLIERDLRIDIGGVPGAVSYLEMDMTGRGGLAIRVRPTVQENRGSGGRCIILAADNQSQGTRTWIAGRVDPSGKGNLILNLQRRRNRISYENILVGAIKAERLVYYAAGKGSAIFTLIIYQRLVICRLRTPRRTPSGKRRVASRMARPFSEAHRRSRRLQSGAPSLNETMQWLDQTMATRN